jgi:hypothetical protein
VNTYGDGTSPLGSKTPADTVGDACDDTDGDLVPDAVDNCPLVVNANQVREMLYSCVCGKEQTVCRGSLLTMPPPP